MYKAFKIIHGLGYARILLEVCVSWGNGCISVAIVADRRHVFEVGVDFAAVTPVSGLEFTGLVLIDPLVSDINWVSW